MPKKKAQEPRRHNFGLITGGKFGQSKCWQEEYSALTMGELIDFQGYIRCFSARLTRHLFDRVRASQFADLVKLMWLQLRSASSPYTDLLLLEPSESGHEENLLAMNLSNLLPTEENLDLLGRFYKLFADRDEWLKRPHVVR